MRLREWFDEFTAETGEPVESVVFGWDDWDYNREDWPEIESRALVAFGDVPASVLDREFDGGFGGTETPNLAAWSESWVLFSATYDGAEWLCWVPRHPVAHKPIRPGGQ